MTQFDHLVFCATTLEEGIEYVEKQLGVRLAAGGKHAKMGTHNALMQTGQNSYFEIIAIDPEANAPPRPRWFSMDNARDRLAVHHQPQLVTWVVNTQNLQHTVNNSTYPYPDGLKMMRESANGELKWSITVPEDGTLPAGGILPTLIEWENQPTHPSNAMPDLGCELKRIRLFHPSVHWLTDHLHSIHCEALADVVPLPKNHSPYFEAEIHCPNGIVTMRSAY